MTLTTLVPTIPLEAIAGILDAINAAGSTNGADYYAFRADYAASPPTSGTTTLSVCDDGGNIIAAAPRANVVGLPVFYVNQAGVGSIYTVTESGAFTAGSILAGRTVCNLMVGGWYTGWNAAGFAGSIAPTQASSKIIGWTALATVNLWASGSPFLTLANSLMRPLVAAVHDGARQGNFWSDGPGSVATTNVLDGVTFNAAGGVQSVVALKDQPDGHNGFVEIVNGDPTQPGHLATLCTQLNGRWVDGTPQSPNVYPLFAGTPLTVGQGDRYARTPLITVGDGLACNFTLDRSNPAAGIDQAGPPALIAGGGAGTAGAVVLGSSSTNSVMQVGVTFGATPVENQPIFYAEFPTFPWLEPEDFMSIVTVDGVAGAQVFAQPASGGSPIGARLLVYGTGFVESDVALIKVLNVGV